MNRQDVSRGSGGREAGGRGCPVGSTPCRAVVNQEAPDRHARPVVAVQRVAQELYCALLRSSGRPVCVPAAPPMREHGRTFRQLRELSVLEVDVIVGGVGVRVAKSLLHRL